MHPLSIYEKIVLSHILGCNVFPLALIWLDIVKEYSWGPERKKLINGHTALIFSMELPSIKLDIKSWIIREKRNKCWTWKKKLNVPIQALSFSYTTKKWAFSDNWILSLKFQKSSQKKLVTTNYLYMSLNRYVWRLHNSNQDSTNSRKMRFQLQIDTNYHLYWELHLFILWFWPKKKKERTTERKLSCSIIAWKKRTTLLRLINESFSTGHVIGGPFPLAFQM